jgi:hypothetical protein
MEERKDYNEMRLPRSFAYTQQAIFPEENEIKPDNKVIHTDDDTE